MRFLSVRPFAAVIALSLATGLAACAPVNTNSTYGTGDIGRTANISYGVIVSMRTVQVQNRGTGVGTLGGAAAGAAAGSFIGGDPRSNIIGAIGGAIIGGIAGTAIEQGVSSGVAVEFIIREDSGQTISLVQSNEDQFRPGERVVLTHGARMRLGRAAPGV